MTSAITINNLQDVQRINVYHRQVRENILPYLEKEEKEWLLEATEEL